MKTEYLPLCEYDKLYPYMTYLNALALRIALETGLRIDDVLSLHGEWISLRKREIHYTAKKTKKKGVAPISESLAAELRKMPRKGYVFPSSSACGHRTRQAVFADVKKACKRCGITANIAPHSTRKTFAVEELKKKSLADVQKELQHSNPLVTMVYAYSDKNAPVLPQKLTNYNTFEIKQAIVELLFEALDPLRERYL